MIQLLADIAASVIPHAEGFWSFSVGNLITIVVGVISFAMLWQRITDRLDTYSKATDRNTSELDTYARMSIQTTIQQHERRISELERTQQAVVSALGRLETNVEWIKQRTPNRHQQSSLGADSGD